MEEIRELIEKYALQNAVKYNAAPNAGAVMGKLMGGNVARVMGGGVGADEKKILECLN